MNAAPTEPIVRVLHLEDNLHDQLFVRDMLEAESLGLQFTNASSRPEFEAALRRETFDLIISDFTLPSYDGQAALAEARKLQPDAAFIFYSGTIGEEIAVDSLKTGATDYVLKQRPQRLVSAVRRALEESRERRRRRAAETALRESEERFRIVARATNDVIWDWDFQTNQVWRNESFAQMFGGATAAVSPFSRWSDLLHEADRERVLSSLSSTIAVGGRIWYSEYRIRRATGEYAYVLDRAFVVYDPRGKPERMIGVMIDMTERKQAEEKIHEQAALLEKAQDAVIVCNLADEVVFWNPSAERIYGWSGAEVMGRPLAELLFRDNPAQFESVRAAVAERGEWLGELRQSDRHNRPVFVQSSWTLVRDDAGQAGSKLMINTDLTAKRVLEEQLIRTQRLESLGLLVGGIAHDLNNSLAPVLMGTSMLAISDLPADAAEIVKTIETSARRGADMVAQVLAFARGGGSTMAPIQMEELIDEMARIIRDAFPRNIRCHLVKEATPWKVTGAATQIHQVLMNLCVNARDAMPHGGELSISLENVVLTEAPSGLPPGTPAGRYVCIRVADTGTGMTQEQLAKVFQPFYTTKAPGKGTGLGLSTSQTIVRNHGGFITVESEVARGTIFKIFLPAVAGTAPETTTSHPALPVGNSEAILVVDDEVAVLAVMRASLENYDYRVFTAASGPEAVSLFSSKQDDIQLVITDMSMPYMDGRATIEALRKIRPDIKIIATSGMEPKLTDDPVPQAQADAFILKPLTVEKLIHATHAQLAKRA